jgi:aspartate kinase
VIIMKFGGTSVGDAAAIERVIEIIRGRLPRRPAVVVSAMAKTTRRLLEAARASAAGDSGTAVGVLADLRAAHAGEAGRLVPPGSRVFGIIDAYFDELEKLLLGLAILGEVPPRGLDKILAYGELLSSAILAGAARERGIETRLLDARKLIKTDNHFGGALPLADPSDALIRGAVVPPAEAGAVPVLQGFIGSTRDGATTTLGFEGSDYTATLVGAAVAAEDIEIWKDVSGLMTADPDVFAAARTVKACSFAEAAELTFFGAKVLHPRAIHPAARAEIPVHIYNSTKPAAAGTEITRTAPPCANAIKSIAFKTPVTLLRAAGGSLERESLVQTLARTLARRGLSPLVFAGSGAQATVALPAGDGALESDLLGEISAFASARIDPDNAIVTLVGEGLHGDPKLLERVAEASRGIELSLVQQGSSAIAVHLVVRRADVPSIVGALHRRFFAEADPAIFA